MPWTSHLRRIAQGIPFRLSLVFLLVFMGVGSASVWHLQANLGPTFLRMEHDNALRSAERVVGGLDAQLSNLNTLTRDWAYWDDMYRYAQKPTVPFEVSNMGPEALKNVNLMGVLILSPTGKTIGFKGMNLSNGKVLTPHVLVPYQSQLLAPLSAAQGVQTCGYARPEDVFILLCSNRISRSDGSGPAVGVVVMVRELSAATLKEVESQSKESFHLAALGADTYAESWPFPGFIHLSPGQLGVRYSASSLTLDYPLRDLAGVPITLVRLPLPRNLVEEGQAVTQSTARTMVAIALVTGFFLLLGVHFWLVLPIARLKRDIRVIHNTQRWDGTVRKNRSDELGELAGEVNGLLCVIHSQVQALEYLSMTDSLTGLANRRHFDQRLHDEIQRVKRTAQPLSVVVLDIDFFKQYNDHYGHPAGDLALQTMAQVLLGCTRQVDLTARLGGEEFAVLLPNTSEQAALDIAEKILKALCAQNVPHARSRVSTVLTTSAGVASLHPGPEAALMLVAHADQALYAAKAAGRNRALRFSGLP